MQTPIRSRIRTLLTAGALLVTGLTPLTVASTAAAAPPGNRDVIANLWSWNWDSVAAECTSVLGPAGYGAVQVSPPQNSLTRSGAVWWDMYQPADYTLTSKFGDQARFSAMVTACHNAGVKVYADAVINHMTGQGSTSYGGASFSKYDYPGLYSGFDFHFFPEDCGNADGTIHDGDFGANAGNVQRCELVGLSDLETEEEYVRATIAGYLNRLIGLGVDGFRVDAAKHISPADLADIYGRLNGTPYLYQEVIFGAGEAVQPSQYVGLGDVLEFQYGRELKDEFNGTGEIRFLSSFGQGWGLSAASDDSVVFIDNHDTERNGSTLNYKNDGTYKIANVFMLAWNFGTPNVYSGFTWSNGEAAPPNANGFVTDTGCGNGWTCFHRAMTGMVGFHNAVRGTAPVDFQAPGSQFIGFSRGGAGFVAINNGGGSATSTFTTGLPAGTYADVIHPGSTVTVNAAGQATLTVGAKDAVAFHVGG
ncbi:MAG: alpha-amylase [Actinomadura sp.]